LRSGLGEKSFEALRPEDDARAGLRRKGAENFVSASNEVMGNVSYNISPKTKVPVGQTITATSTNGSTEDASEFSAPRKVVAS
jgi:hypothetical protein